MARIAVSKALGQVPLSKTYQSLRNLPAWGRAGVVKNFDSGRRFRSDARGFCKCVSDLIMLHSISHAPDQIWPRAEAR